MKESISFTSALAIVFITLKLCHVIFWSWWLILLPIYAVPLVVLIPLLMIYILHITYEFISASFKK